MTTGDRFRRLLAAGFTPEQIALVLDMFEEDAAARRAENAKRVRRLRELRNVPKDWEQRRERIFIRDNFTCVYCGSTEEPLHCDHVFPASRGGSSEPDNLVTACAACNFSKGDKTPEEWRR